MIEPKGAKFSGVMGVGWTGTREGWRGCVRVSRVSTALDSRPVAPGAGA